MNGYDLSHFITKVRLNLDEIRENDSSFEGGADEEDLETIVKGKIEEAIRYVHQFADPSLVEGVSFNPGEEDEVTVTNIDNKNKYYSYSFELPEGCIRVLYAHVKGWTRRVNDFIFDDTVSYSSLNHVFSTGTPSRPKAALAENATKIELYSSTESNLQKTDLTLSLVYSDVTTEEEVEGQDVETQDDSEDDPETITKYNISPKLETALYYYLTGLVLQVLRDSHAETMFQQAIVNMGLASKLKEE